MDKFDYCYHSFHDDACLSCWRGRAKTAERHLDWLLLSFKRTRDFLDEQFGGNLELMLKEADECLK